MSFGDTVIFWTLTYPLGLIIGTLFAISRLFGRIKILHKKRFPRRPRSIILISNHPSLWEPILLSYLFFPWFIFWPKTIPINTPDNGNYYENLWWLPFRPVFIPVFRGKEGDTSAIRKMQKVIQRGGNIILFPEGGRTFKGDKFLFSPKGNKIRCLKEGVASLAICTRELCTVVPVWVENTGRVLPAGSVFPRFWRQAIIKVGQPIKINDAISRGKLNEQLASAMLSLADEV